jgi:hypothetical protein
LGTLTRIWVAAAVAAAALVAGVLLLAEGTGAPATPAIRALSVHASVDRVRAAFADTVVARIVVSGDRRRVDLSKAKVSATLGPFTRLGAPRTTRATRGHVDVVTTEVQVACLQESCLPTRDRLAAELGAVDVTAPRKGGGVAHAHAAFPAVSIERRVTQGDVNSKPPPFRTELTPPPFRYRFPPGTAALVLEILAALLAVAAVALTASVVAGEVRRRRLRARGELGRALELARVARVRSPRDRRKALALLAHLLGPRHEPLAGSAETLAWSRPAPTPEALEDLVATAEREVNGH